MRNKKASHVGTVLSFVIFITFLVFLYSILQPQTKIKEDKQTALDYLEIEILDKISADMTTVTVSSDSNPSDYDCLRINNSGADVTGLDLIAKDKNGNIINSISSGGFSKIAWADEIFFKIYYSAESFEDFPTTNSNCADAVIESITIDEHIFETKIIELKNEYETEYNSLKGELKVSEEKFGFSFVLSNGTVIETSEEEVLTSIYVEETPIQYIDSLADIRFGTMKLRVW